MTAVTIQSEPDTPTPRNTRHTRHTRSWLGPAAFIVLVIVAFAVLSIAFAADLAGGSPLARGVSAMIAVFWAARLGVQFLLFDARPFLTRWYLKVGYHGLTVVFVYLAAVYTWCALHPGSTSP